MATLNRSVKISLTVSLISLFIYVSYVVRGSYVIFFGYLANSRGEVNYVTWLGSAFWASHVGVTARFIGLIMSLIAIFLLWIKSWAFLRVKKFIVVALILESVSFIGLIPSLWLLLNPQSRIFTPALGYGYLIQILFTVPFLLALAYKVAKYREGSQKPQLLKISGLTFVGYTIALVTNEVSRWTSMISSTSLQFIEGIRAVGFINALVLMPCAIIFAIAGAYRLFHQKNQSAMRWFGVSLLVIGLNYTIYLIFAYFVNALNTLPVVDIWTIPLFALGITLLLNSKKHPLTRSRILD
jgi:hypothetical protein